MADTTSKGTFKYTCFNGFSRGELSRWIFAYSKTEFEDNRIDKADLPRVKLALPLGQLPVLYWISPDGQREMTLFQCGSVTRFLAATCGLAGSNPVETAKADEAFETLKEFQDAFIHAANDMNQFRKDQEMQKIKSEIAPRVMNYLEKRLEANGGKNLAGGEGHTYADIFVGSVFDMLAARPTMKLDLSPYPGLAGLAKTIAESEGVRNYLDKRPKLDF